MLGPVPALAGSVCCRSPGPFVPGAAGARVAGRPLWEELRQALQGCGLLELRAGCDPFHSPIVVSEGKRLAQGFTHVLRMEPQASLALCTPLQKVEVVIQERPGESEMPGVSVCPAGKSHPLFGHRRGLRGASLGGSWHCALDGRLWKNHRMPSKQRTRGCHHGNRWVEVAPEAGVGRLWLDPGSPGSQEFANTELGGPRGL